LESIISENVPRKNTIHAFADYFRFRDLDVENALQKITLSALNAEKARQSPGFF
jgi:hypothetical protein